MTEPYDMRPGFVSTPIETQQLSQSQPTHLLEKGNGPQDAIRLDGPRLARLHKDSFGLLL